MDLRRNLKIQTAMQLTIQSLAVLEIRALAP
jgi:hypothetical protein